MRYNEYEMVFSSARLNIYKIACDGDNIKALILYRHNIKLCQKFYGVLNVFEVALRNAIDRHKSFRNKIAHHEAICFNSIGQKSMLPAQTHYELILKYVEFLGYPKNHLFFGLDVRPEFVMNKIHNL